MIETPAPRRPRGARGLHSASAGATARAAGARGQIELTGRAAAEHAARLGSLASRLTGCSAGKLGSVAGLAGLDHAVSARAAGRRGVVRAAARHGCTEAERQESSQFESASHCGVTPSDAPNAESRLGAVSPEGLATVSKGAAAREELEIIFFGRIRSQRATSVRAPASFVTRPSSRIVLARRRRIVSDSWAQPRCS